MRHHAIPRWFRDRVRFVRCISYASHTVAGFKLKVDPHGSTSAAKIREMREQRLFSLGIASLSRGQHILHAVRHVSLLADQCGLAVFAKPRIA